MHKKKLFAFLAMAHCGHGQTHLLPPTCALRCWENTKYVGDCLDDFDCLCRESKYQNSVVQCLYSQCDTAHYGSALHHTISQCAGAIGKNIIAPPIRKHDALRRREHEDQEGATVIGSGSAYGFPTESRTYPTDSVILRTQSVVALIKATANSLDDNPSLVLPTLALTAPALTSATPTLLSDSDLSGALLLTSSNTSTPVIFEGLAPEEGAGIKVPTIITLAILYFAF